MNTPRCCPAQPRAGDEARQRGARLRRVREVACLIVPGTLLALLPKCPMCLAAYVALGAGFTLSYTSAHLLMRALTALCIGTLALCAVRRVVSCCQNKQTSNLQPTQTHP
jgi:tRNA(Arg) A34 adenosine deaminase TadA